MDKTIKTIEFEIANDMGVLTLRGNVGHEREDVLKEALMVSLENSDLVLVNMESVTSIDDRCLQVLDAARERALAMNKRMALWGLAAENQ